MNKYQQKLKKERAEIRTNERLQFKAGQIVLRALGVVPIYILCVEFGWGRVRLLRYLQRYIKVMHAVSSKQIALQRLEEEIENRTKLRHDDGSWYDMSGFGRKEIE